MRAKYLLVALCLALCLSFAMVAVAKEKTPEEIAEAPPVEIQPDALKYRIVLFKDFTVADEFKKDVKDEREVTQAAAMIRLKDMKGFAAVGTFAGTAPTEPALFVEAKIVDHRMVSGAGRMWGGAFAGSSRLTYEVKVIDAQSGATVGETKLTSSNSSMGAAWTGGQTDRELPGFLGKMIADFIAAKAKK
jgi:hypothetical protein